IRSIAWALGGDTFVRFRVGVGKPRQPGREAGIGHVLSRFTVAEREVVEDVVQGVAEALELALREGVEAAMTTCNRRSPV
ncbi:MAG: aminoacyl-tRNA hydrolase, partial [Candidatus Dormibacteraceae bacterium]